MLNAMAVIDFHAHAFPDALAERAVPQLAAEGGIVPTLSGKIGALVAAMDAAAITSFDPSHSRPLL